MLRHEKSIEGRHRAEIDVDLSEDLEGVTVTLADGQTDEHFADDEHVRSVGDSGTGTHYYDDETDANAGTSPVRLVEGQHT